MPEPYSRRSALRQATDPLHRELDETVAGYELRKADHYTAFLEASAAPLLALEQLLESANVAALLPDWPDRRRSNALRDDLQRLNRPAMPCRLRRQHPSRSEMFGMLYVLEGSRLGARWLYARVCSSADSRVGDARAYLQAHDPALWRSFLATLEASQEIGDAAAMLAAARFSFGLFQRSFEKFLPAPAAGLA